MNYIMKHADDTAIKSLVHKVLSLAFVGLLFRGWFQGQRMNTVIVMRSGTVKNQRNDPVQSIQFIVLGVKVGR